LAFFLIPLALLAISALFTSGSGKGAVSMGVFLIIVCVLSFLYFMYWWYRQEGRAKTKACFEKRQHRKDVRILVQAVVWQLPLNHVFLTQYFPSCLLYQVMNDVMEEWEPLRDTVEKLKYHTAFPGSDDDDEVVKKVESEESGDTMDDDLVRNVESADTMDVMEEE
jgi:hypothetical protein